MKCRKLIAALLSILMSLSSLTSAFAIDSFDPVLAQRSFDQLISGTVKLVNGIEIDAVPEQWDEETRFSYSLCFCGDVNLAEGQYTTGALDSGGLDSCVSKKLQKYMKNADVMCLNNEFSYTTRGTPLDGKAFTFRANPSRTDVLKQLGVDIAILANNHVYDYCDTGLSDTFDALDNAGIARIGAGRNLQEASSIHYVKLKNCTVAYLAASRVEWSAQTKPATKNDMGVFYTAYDTDLLYRRVKEAKKAADFVVVCMHWGIEGTSDLEEYQLDVGKGLVEAGADVVVGDHPHQLQGVRYINDVPVFYSLGNFWFSRKAEYTMLLNVVISGDKYGVREVHCQVIPAYQSDARVTWLEGGAQSEMYRYLESLPYSNISVDKDGKISPKS